jgi:uncharacterized membrane protein
MANISSIPVVLVSYLTPILNLIQPFIVPLKVLFSALLFIYILYQICRLYLFLKQLKEKSVLLELQPLKNTEQSSYTTQQLFAILHGLAKQRSFVHRLFDIQKSYAFEIVSTKNGGITYYTRIGIKEGE